MKLHLPHKLRKALVSCICGVTALGTTISTGTIATGGALFVAFATGQALAEDVTTEGDGSADSGDETTPTTVVDTLTYDGTEGTTTPIWTSDGAGEGVFSDGDSAIFTGGTTDVTLGSSVNAAEVEVAVGAAATISSDANAESPYSVTVGTVSNAGTLTLNAATTVTDSLELTGGTFASVDDFSTSADTTLGNVTLGTTDAMGKITLSGAVEFTGAVTNNVVLDLTGATVTVSADTLSGLTSTSVYSDATNGNGYTTTTYTLVSNVGTGSIASAVAITAGSSTTTLGTDGTFSVTSDIYYINNGTVSYDDNAMSGASSLWINSGATLKMTSDWKKNVDLAGGTMIFNSGSMNNSETKTITLHSTTNADGSVTRSNNVLSMGGSTLNSQITGTGNLVLEQNSSGVFYMNSSIDFVGDLTIKGTILAGQTWNSDSVSAVINNTGAVTVASGATLSMSSNAKFGTNVTSLTLKDGSTLYTEGNCLTTGLTLDGAVGGTGITVERKTTSAWNYNLRNVTGTGDLTLKNTETGSAWLEGNFTYTGSLTLQAKGSIDLQNGASLNNSGVINIAEGTVNMNSGSTIGSNVTKVNVSGGTLHATNGSTISATGGIELSGGTLSVGESKNLDNAITVSAASNLTGGKNAVISGAITGTNGNLTVSGASGTGTGANTAFYLSGNINLGSNSLIVSGGVVSIGNAANADNVANLTMKDIQVNDGTLQIYRAGGTANTGIVLNGGDIHVQAMADGTGKLAFNSLEVKQEGTISNTWGTTLEFATLTGSANLSLQKGNNNTPDITFSTLSDYTGTLSANYDGVTINSAAQSSGTATVTATSKSTTAFTKSGEGSVSLANHTANADFTVSAGTLTATSLTANGAVSLTGGKLAVSTLTLGDAATLSLTGGTFAANAGMSIDKATTLGNVTLDSSYTVDEATAYHTLTLSGAVTFTGAVTNNAALTLSGSSFSITADAYASLTPTGEKTYSNTETGNGYLGGTYTLIANNTGASLSFGEGVDSVTLNLPDGTNTATLNADGTFTSAGFGGTYYINNSAEYDATEMAAATGISVASGQTFTITGSETLTALPVSVVLNSATVDEQTVGANVVVDGVNIGEDGAGISGTGNVTTKGDVHVLGSSSINNAGTLTVDGGTLTIDSRTKDTAALGSNITGITVQDGGSMNFGGADWDKAVTLYNGTIIMAPQGSLGSNSVVTLVSAEGATAEQYSTNVITAVNSTLRASVTGTGNLELKRYDDGTDHVFNIAGSIAHTGDLTISDGATITGGSITNKGNVTLSGISISGGSINNTGTLTLQSQAVNYGYIGGNVTSIILENGTLNTEGKLVTHAIVSNATEGTYANKVYISGADNPFVSTISGDGDLTIEVASGYQSHFYGKTAGLTADLTLTGSGTINLGHSGSGDWGNPIVNHAGDLIIDGATVNMGGKQGMDNESTIANTGNLIISSGSLNVGTHNTDGEASPTINLEGSGNATGKIVVSGTGAMTLTKGSVTAKGLEVSGGMLSLGSGITLTGGVTDTDGNAVDAIRISGGTTTATSFALNDKVSLALSGGSLSLSDTLTVGTGGTATITGGTLSATNGIELAGGALNLGAGYNLGTDINATAASTIYGAANSKLSGTLSSEGADVTIVSSATTPGSSNAHGDGVRLAGNIDLGSNNLIVQGGVVLIGTGESNAHNSTVTANTIEVQTGATLQLGHGTGTLNTGVTLNGGNMLVQATDTVSGSTLAMNTLTVSQNATLSSNWGTNITFSELTGSGNLSLKGNYSTQNTTFTTLNNYKGTLSTSNVNLTINSAHQDEGNTATISGTTQSTTDFVKSGKGSLVLGTHTANANVLLTEGTLVANTLTLGANASLTLEGGIFGVTNAIETGVATTLGAATLGTSVTVGETTTDYLGAITLTGDVQFDNKVTTNVTLTLAGDISLETAAIANVHPSDSGYNDGTTENSSGNGFAYGTYTIVTAEGSGSIVLKDYVTTTTDAVYDDNGELVSEGTTSTELKEVTSKDITVGTSNATLTVAEDGKSASFELAGEGGTYYINNSADYGEYAEYIKDANAIYVQKDQSITFDSGENWEKRIDLAGGTAIFNGASLNSAEAVTLHSTTNADGTVTFSDNTISMYNATLGTNVTGTGNLTIEKTGTDTVLYVKSTIDNVGDLTLSGGVEVQSGASINNTGTLTLLNNSLDFGYVGSNVTGITLNNGTLTSSAEMKLVGITLAGAGTLSATNNVYSSISGEGDLTLTGSHMYRDEMSHVGNVNIATSGTIELFANYSLDGSKAILNNTGSVTVSQGTLQVWADGTITSNVNQIVVSGEGKLQVDANAGSIAAKGLSMTGGTIVLSKELALSGGAKDADGNAVDTLMLTGGTLNVINADNALAYSATLGNVAINSNYTATAEDGTSTQYRAVTIGTADATTTFVGTVQSNAALTINGKDIAVSGLSNLTSADVTLAEGQSGFAHTAYTLVNGAAGSSLAFGSSSVSISDELAEGLVGGTKIVTNGGSATIAVATESTYHVATDSATNGIAYTDIANNAYGVAIDTISLEGGKLNVAKNNTVTQNITLTADSNIFASAGADAERASIKGSISGDYNLTITSDAKTVSGGSHGDFAILASDVNIGSKDLTINGIVRLSDADWNSAASTASIVAGNIVVSTGSTLEIQRVGAALGAGENGIATTGLTLAGSTLHLQNVSDANGGNGTGTMAFGTLTVNAATDADGNALSSTITKGYWGGSTSFTSLKGDGNLTLSSDLTTTIGKLDGYTGQLTVSKGTLNFADNLTVTGNSLQLTGGKLASSGALQISGNGSVTMSGGTLGATRIELTGGQLTYAGGGMDLSNTAGKLSFTGGTFTAAADFTLGGNMTLGGVTLSSVGYLGGDNGDEARAYAITLGNGGTTTFTGTVTNAGNLTLGGSLVVEDVTALDKSDDSVTIAYGESGYNKGTYTLVKVESTAAAQDGETITVTPSLTVTADSVTVKDMGTANITVADGAATFGFAETTYHVGSDKESTAYSTITGIETTDGVNFTTIALDGGVLTADGDIAEDITVTKASGITATAASDLSGMVTASGDNTDRSLTLDGTAAALTLSGTLISVDSLTTEGTVNLTGNVNLADGQGTITVNSGNTVFGKLGENVGGTSTNTLGVSELIVNEGATLTVSRKASSVTGEAFTTAPDLTLNGGTLHMQAMEGSSTTAGLVFGTLTVTGDSYVTSEWSHTTFFNTMTGSGNLTIEKYVNSADWLYGHTTYMGINSLVDYTGTLTMADSDEMKLYLLSANQGENKSGSVLGTTYSSAAEGSFTKLGEGSLTLDKHVAEGSFTVEAGTLNVDSLTLGTVASTSTTDGEGNTTTSTIATSTGNVVLNGGTLNIGTGGIATVTADDMTGVTSTITLAGGTLGATGEGWSTELATSVTGDATINTTTAGAETGAAITMGDISVAEGKTLTIAGAGSLTLNELDAATGAIDLKRTASLVLNGSGTVGTWDLADSSATTSTIKVATGESLTINGVTNSGSEIDTSAETGTQHWWSLLTSGRVEEGYDGTIIINSVVNTSNSDYASGDTSHTISGNYVVNGNMHLNAWGASTYALVDENASLTVNAATRANADGSSTSLAGNLKLWNAQTLEVKGDVTVAGLITLGKNTDVSADWGNTLAISGGAVTANGITLEADTKNGHSITLTSGSLTLGAEGIHASTAENAEKLGAYTITLAGGTLGASASWASDLAVTLGSADGLTIASGADNTITLSGATTFAGAVTNTGNLVLSGALTVDDAALESMDKADGVYSYNGVSGFLNATYTLVNGGDGASLTFGTEEVTTGSEETGDLATTTQNKTTSTITVGSNTYTVTAANGGATFAGNNGVYYVNADMARTDDADAMASATTLSVKDSSLNYTGAKWNKAVVLNNGSFSVNKMEAGSSVLLEGGSNTLTASENTGIYASVTGTGDLTLTGSYKYRGEMTHEGNVVVDTDGTIEIFANYGNDANDKGRFDNAGSVTVSQGTLWVYASGTIGSRDGATSNVTQIVVNDGGKLQVDANAGSIAAQGLTMTGGSIELNKGITLVGDAASLSLTGGTFTTTADQSFGVNATLGNVSLVGTTTTTTTDAVLDGEGNITTPATTTTTITNTTIGAADTTTTFTGTVSNSGGKLTMLGSFNVDSLEGLTFTLAEGTEGTNGFRGATYTLITSTTQEGGSSLLDLTGVTGLTVMGETKELTITDTAATFGAVTDIYYVATGSVTYGVAAEDGIDTARQLVLEGGNLNLATSLNEAATGGIKLTSEAMVNLASGVTLSSSQVELGATMTLNGSGTYVETAPNGNVKVHGAWDGLVKLSGSMAGTNLNNYGSVISTIELSGATGYLQGGSNDYVADVVFTGVNEDGTGTAVTFTNGYGGDVHTFSGKVSGAGDVVRNGAGSEQSYVFSGDVSGWTGSFILADANDGYNTNVTFSGAASVVNANISNTSTDALKVTYDSTGMTGGMVVNSTISGAVDVTFSGAGLTYFNGNHAADYSGTTTLAEGALYVAETSKLTSVVVNAGAALALSATTDRTVDTAISGSGIVGNTGKGALTLSNLATDFTGRLFAYEEAGSIVVGSALDTSALAISGAGHVTLAGATNSITNLSMVAGSTVENGSGVLTLSGEITVDLASLVRLTASDDVTYSYNTNPGVNTVNDSGFRTGTYTLVLNSNGGTINVAEGTTIMVNGKAGTLSQAADGSVLFSAIDGVYYVNGDMAYVDDTSMAGATSILVKNSTLDLDKGYDKAHAFVLDGATLRQDTSSLKEGTTITLTGAESTLAMANTTMNAVIDGTADLVLERITSEHDKEYNNDFFIAGTIKNEGDVTLKMGSTTTSETDATTGEVTTTTTPATGEIVFNSGSVVANGGDFIVTQDTPVIIKDGADFSAADVVNSGSITVQGDIKVNTYTIGTDITTNTDTNGRLSIDAGKSLTITNLAAYQYNQSSNPHCEGFWTLVTDGVSFNSGGGTVVLQTNADGNGLLNLDYLYTEAGDVTRSLYGNFKVAGDLSVNNGAAHQEIIISGKTTSLTVTGDASFLSKQELFVSNGGSLTVDGTLYLGHESTADNYYANISIGTSTSALSSNVTLGGLVFQNYHTGTANHEDYNYLRLGNGALTFVDDGTNKAQVTIGSNITGLNAGDVVARLELDGGPVKTATTGSGPALGWEVNEHIAVDIVNVDFDTTAGGTITFNGDTEFWGTASLTGVAGSGLELAGDLSVLDLKTLVYEGNGDLAEGTNGFGSAKYYLVKSVENEDETTPTVTLGTDPDGNAITTRKDVTVGGLTVTTITPEKVDMSEELGEGAYYTDATITRTETSATYDVTTDTTGAYFTASDTVYQVNVAGTELAANGNFVTYREVTEAAQAKNIIATAISLNSDTGLTISGYSPTKWHTTAQTVEEDIIVNYTDAKLYGGVQSVVNGNITGTEGSSLTVNSDVTDAAYIAAVGNGGVAAYQASMALRGNIDLTADKSGNGGNLTITGGWLSFGQGEATGEKDAYGTEIYIQSTNSLTANSVTVKEGATFEIYHKADSSADSRYVNLTNGITLEGGRIFVRTVEEANATVGNKLYMGALTVKDGTDADGNTVASSLGAYWNGQLEFDSLSGSGALNIMGPDAVTGGLKHGFTFATLNDYAGAMTVSKNTAYGSSTSGANVDVLEGTFTADSSLNVVHGNVTLGSNVTTTVKKDDGTTEDVTTTTGVIVKGDVSVANSDSTLTLNGTTTVEGAVTLADSGSIGVNDGSSISGDVTMTGGTLNVNDNSSLSGKVEMSGGSVTMNDSSALTGSTVNISGGSFTVNSGASITDAAAVNVSGGTLYLKDVNNYGTGAATDTTVTLSGTGTLYFEGNAYGVSDSALNLVMSNGGVLDLTNKTLKGSLKLASTDDSTTSIVKGGGGLRTDISGEGNLTFAYTTNGEYYIYSNDQSETNLMLDYDGDFTVTGDGHDNAKAVVLGHNYNGTDYSTTLTGEGKVSVVDNGTLQVRAGSVISKTGGVEVVDGGKLQVDANSSEIDTTVTAKQTVDGVAQTAATITARDAGTTDAPKYVAYENVTVSGTEISTYSNGTMSNASIDVDKEYAIKGVTLEDCNFTVDAALALGSSSSGAAKLTNATFDIGMAGAVWGEASSITFAQDAIHTLTLGAEANGGLAMVGNSGTHTGVDGLVYTATKVTTSQLEGLINFVSESNMADFTLNVDGDLLKGLVASSEGGDILFVFTAPSSAALMSEDGVDSVLESSYNIDGLKFTLGESFADSGYGIDTEASANFSKNGQVAVYLTKNPEGAVASIPEPTTATLSLLALAALAARRRRK